MRSDYSLYVVALICFIIAGMFLASAVPGYTLEETLGQMVIAIFVILGIVFAVGGYALRPKVAVPTITTPPPLPAEPSPPPPVEEEVEEVPVAPPPPTPTPPPAEEVPTPSPALEEPAKVEEEKAAEKPVRRRRKKKTA